MASTCALRARCGSAPPPGRPDGSAGVRESASAARRSVSFASSSATMHSSAGRGGYVVEPSSRSLIVRMSQGSEMSSSDSQPVPAGARRSGSYLYYRHTLPVRFMHWINVVALTVLLMSGLNIFSAHPALYWGKSSYSGRPPLFEISTREDDDGDPVGVTTIFGHDFVTTGVLGASAGPDCELVGRAFPSWLPIPDRRCLAMARRWH